MPVLSEMAFELAGQTSARAGIKPPDMVKNTHDAGFTMR